jgi:hypothetical protein
MRGHSSARVAVAIMKAPQNRSRIMQADAASAAFGAPPRQFRGGVTLVHQTRVDLKNGTQLTSEFVPH